MILSLNSWSSTPQPQTKNLDLNSPNVKHQIANAITDLRVCNQTLLDTTTAYVECSTNTHGSLQFWQTPSFVIGGFVVTASVSAAVICLSHLMGACK